MKLSENDFYIQYPHLPDHLWTKFQPKIWSRVQIWEFILHFSNALFGLNQHREDALHFTSFTYQERNWLLLSQLNFIEVHFEHLDCKRVWAFSAGHTSRNSFNFFWLEIIKWGVLHQKHASTSSSQFLELHHIWFLKDSPFE